jgi:predicted HicB family RNase H-like nuclease
MRYKGMVAQFEYIPPVRVYVGEVINCPDVVSFGASSLPELKKVMEEAVDSYLEHRKKQLSAKVSGALIEHH